MSDYKPYDTAPIIRLLSRMHSLGWYGGTHDLCKITIEGGFEHNLNGRATETWQLVYVVEFPDLTTSDGKILLKADKVKDDTLAGAINKLLARQPIQI